MQGSRVILESPARRAKELTWQKCWQYWVDDWVGESVLFFSAIANFSNFSRSATIVALVSVCALRFCSASSSAIFTPNSVAYHCRVRRQHVTRIINARRIKCHRSPPRGVAVLNSVVSSRLRVCFFCVQALNYYKSTKLEDISSKRNFSVCIHHNQVR